MLKKIPEKTIESLYSNSIKLYFELMNPMINKISDVAFELNQMCQKIILIFEESKIANIAINIFNFH